MPKAGPKLTQEAGSISEQVYETYPRAESTSLDLLWMAFDLIRQALLSLPLTAYISFAFSLLFLAFFATSYLSGVKN